MGLTLLNTLLLAQLFYRGGETNMPSGFVASTYWFTMSALPILHECWQVQIVLFGIWVSGLLWCSIRYQDVPTEESFLITLISCFLAPTQGIAISGILTLWLHLLMKGYMTWRVWCASLIGVALYAMIMVILHYMGWMEWLWIENIPRLSWQMWIISLGVIIATFMAIILPIRKPSIGSGVMYILVILTGIGYGVCNILMNNLSH